EAGACSVACREDDDCLPGDQCADFGNGPSCARGCAAPSDCVLAGPSWDEDNWSCDQGACNYLGCHSDEECGEGTLCRPFAGVTEVLLGYDAPVCVPVCNLAEDCDMGIEPTTADNYQCVFGGCEWIGCVGDSECGSS